MKEAVSALSPIIRNRLRGLPAYVLDYSDLIVANSVEKPLLKPVVLAGPTCGEKQVRWACAQFSGWQGLRTVHTGLLPTMATWHYSNILYPAPLLS